MRVIGFGHRSRMGKDSAAKFLQTILAHKGLRTKRISFASKLKQVCHELYGWAGVKDAQWYEDHEADRSVVLPALGMTVVDLWIKFGTTCCRELIHQDTWVNCCLMEDKNVDVLIITDVRFPNEARIIHNSGGKLVKVVRPSVPLRDSPADVALDDYEGWDYELVAENLKDLNTAVEIMAKEFYHG